MWTNLWDGILQEPDDRLVKTELRGPGNTGDEAEGEDGDDGKAGPSAGTSPISAIDGIEAEDWDEKMEITPFSPDDKNVENEHQHQPALRR